MVETPKPRPFLKWAGGKTQLLPELLKRIPKTWNRETDFYVEPFVGAGALFWELQPAHAILNDANEELYIAWLALEACYIKEFFTVLGALRGYYAARPEETYYEWRALKVKPDYIGMRAARTVFLNKAGFNGLYRVNADGGFNVPWGRNPKANIFDEENLAACAEFLRGADLVFHRGDFADALPAAPPPGTLVYCDPPYVPVSKTSNFTTYTAGGFPYVDQLRLVQYAVWLRDCGCHVMLSQAADEILIDQYRRCGFKCDLVSARRNVNSKAGKRGPVGEYIIHGGK
jgi:DNA adenine methylase